MNTGSWSPYAGSCSVPRPWSNGPKLQTCQDYERAFVGQRHVDHGRRVKNGYFGDAGGPLGEDLHHVLSYRAMMGWFDAHLTPQNSDMFKSIQSLDRTAHPPVGSPNLKHQ